MAQENNCDLIVMGTHGRTGLCRILMGNTAESVLPRAKCPVLVVKQPRITIPLALGWTSARQEATTQGARMMVGEGKDGAGTTSA